MDPNARRLRIEQLAHEIWEAEGRPDNQSARHWAMAERLADAELRVAEQGGSTLTPRSEDPDTP